MLNDSAPTSAATSAPPHSARAFSSVATAIAAIVLGANTPLPLLTIYQSQWNFSTALLSVVYGLYTVGVVGTVFIIGPLSDAVGRKRILVPALLVMALGLLTCLLAANVWVLMTGRVLQGIAVGAGTTTAVAMLAELDPAIGARGRVAITATLATVIGLAGGPLVAGALAEFAPVPTVLPYLAALALVTLSLIRLRSVPETVESLGPFRFQIPRIRIPKAIAAVFYLATFVEIVAYAIAGTFAGLGSSFAGDLLGIQNHFAAGLVVAALFISSAVGQLTTRKWPPHRAMQIGLLTLLGGLGCFGASLVERIAIMFFLSSILLGVAHGLCYLGSQELIDRIAPIGMRAQVLSGFQLGLYVGATVPPVLIGVAAKAVSFEAATLVFIAVHAVMTAVALAWVGREPNPKAANVHSLDAATQPRPQ